MPPRTSNVTFRTLQKSTTPSRFKNLSYQEEPKLGRTLECCDVQPKGQLQLRRVKAFQSWEGPIEPFEPFALQRWKEAQQWPPVSDSMLYHRWLHPPSECSLAVTLTLTSLEQCRQLKWCQCSVALTRTGQGSLVGWKDVSFEACGLPLCSAFPCFLTRMVQAPWAKTSSVQCSRLWIRRPRTQTC